MTLDSTNAIVIPNRANIGSYLTFGTYVVPTNVGAATLVDTPFIKAFTMWVFSSTGDEFYPSQLAREFDTGRIRQRTWDKSNKKWLSGWQELALTYSSGLTLLNGWKTMMTAYQPCTSRSGNVACVSVTIKNPADVATFTYEPFRFLYPPANTMRGYAFDEKGNNYPFETGSSGYFGWQKTIPANTVVSINFMYPCKI